MRVVVLEGEVLVFELKNIPHGWVDAHGWERSWLSGKLEFRLLQMIFVQMKVAECVNKLARHEVADLSHHHGEQGVGGDIERDTQE